MTFWMVRAGRHGEEEQEALDNNLVTIGWNKIPNLGNIKDKDSLKKIYSDTYPNKTPMHVARVVGQIWDFIKEIKKRRSGSPSTKNSIINSNRKNRRGYAVETLCQCVKDRSYFRKS